MTATSACSNNARFFRLVVAVVVTLVAVGIFTTPHATADPHDCYEILEPFDPYGLVWDIGVPVDFSTLTEVEILVDDYTGQIDDALAAETDGLTPPDEIGSDELIDDARWEIQGTVELGRDLAGCPDF